jgi:hypothetical protein
MARTRQEVRNFLESQVGFSVNAKCGIYQGQCVSLVKPLLEFLGIENPYSGRGNARDVGSNLVREGIAEYGTGWLQVVVNQDMGYIGGVHYGHIWIDLSGEMNYEQNGAKALVVTKGTRPLSQGQLIYNLDKYVSYEVEPTAPAKSDSEIANEVIAGEWGIGQDRIDRLVNAGYDYYAIQAIVNSIVGNTTAPRKSNEVIADEVLAGAWGNGADRQNRLTAAGYDFEAVQGIVDARILNHDVQQDNEIVAEQVIAGAWGDGDDRRNRLVAAGYDYNAVQSMVNELLAKNTLGRATTEQVANQVIAGEWGNGQERRDRLEAAGYDADRVQSMVNGKLGV